MGKGLPTKEEVIQKVRDLKTGAQPRETIAAWAMSFIVDESIGVTDEPVWKMLKKLGAIDLVGANESYLFSDEDIAEWVNALCAKE